MTRAKIRVQTILISFPNGRGHTLRGVVYSPTRFSTAVICAHGFPGDSTGGTHRRALALAKAGFLVMRFDFTGCGLSDGKHEARVMSGDVRDLKAAITFLSQHVEYRSLVLFGHSTGAIDVAFAAADKRVHAAILSGGQAYLDRGVHLEFTAHQVRELWTHGFTRTPYVMEWSGKRERISKAYYDEFFTLNLPRALQRLRKPTLVVHGEKDEAVPVQCASEVYSLLPGPKKLVIIPRADHRYRVNTKAYYAALIRFLRGTERARTTASRARTASSTR